MKRAIDSDEEEEEVEEDKEDKDTTACGDDDLIGIDQAHADNEDLASRPAWMRYLPRRSLGQPVTAAMATATATATVIATDSPRKRVVVPRRNRAEGPSVSAKSTRSLPSSTVEEEAVLSCASPWISEDFSPSLATAAQSDDDEERARRRKRNRPAHVDEASLLVEMFSISKS